MTPEQKVANIEAQIAACERGATNIVTCPYCQLPNVQGAEELCCVTFARAVGAILERREIADQIEEIEILRERIDREPKIVTIH